LAADTVNPMRDKNATVHHRFLPFLNNRLLPSKCINANRVLRLASDSGIRGGS
jgi:hypothetical protein